MAYCRRTLDGAGRPTAVLWGDSHAEHLYPGLKDLDRKRDWLLIAHSSCPPLSETDIVNDQPRCRARTDQVLSWLLAQPSIEEVVLAFFGYYAETTDEAFIHRHGPTGPSKTRIDGHADANGKSLAFREGLARTISRLTSAGKRVTIVLDVPEMPFDPQACIFRPRIVLDEAACHVPRARAEARRQTLQALERWSRRAHPDVRVVDLLAVVCDRDGCPVIRNGLPIYRDSHHLSLAGSQLAAAAILREME